MSRSHRQSFQFRHCALPFVERSERSHTKTQSHGEVKKIQRVTTDCRGVALGKIALSK
jgi:hypothetical protein